MAKLRGVILTGMPLRPLVAVAKALTEPLYPESGMLNGEYDEP